MLGAFATVLLVAACTSGGGSSTASTSRASDRPPFEYVGATAAIGGDGDLVVLDTEPSEVVDDEGDAVVDGGPRAVGAAVRQADATWVELPEPPALIAVELLPVDDTVAVVGLDCPEEPCREATLAGAVLTADDGSWEPLDFNVELDGGPVMAYDNGPQAIGNGWVSWIGTFHHLTPSGDVLAVDRALEQRPSGPRPVTGPGSPPITVQCVVGGSLLNYGTIQLDDVDSPGTLTEQITETAVFDADESDAGWNDVEVPSGLDATSATTTRLCGPLGPILVDATHELAFDSQVGTWTERPTGLPPPLDANRPSIDHDLLDDGRILLIGRFYGAEAVEAGTEVSPIVIRYPDGTYEVTDIVVDDVVAAGNVAYALTDVETDPYRPARYRTADIRPIDLPD
jgi:hypothetical protein